MQDVTHEHVEAGRVRKPARSKTGCVTCLRRKTKCNEQKPRCGHCERLNLQCLWRAPPSRTTISGQASVPVNTLPRQQEPSPFPQLGDSVLDVFDFNSSIWQDTSTLDPSALDWLSTGPSSVFGPAPDAGTVTARTTLGEGSQPAYDGLLSSPGAVNNANVASPASSTDPGGHALVEHFLASVVPPILSSVEVGPRWTSTKMLLASLAASSTMVRQAMMAFSALDVTDARETTRPSDHRNHYDKAARDYSKQVSSARKDPQALHANGLQHTLATAFFLAYSDLLTNRVRDAQGVLRDAAYLLSCYRTRELSSAERRLITWVRLVDGRASSAGADGAFLAETDNAPYDTGTQSKTSPDATAVQKADTDIEEILFDILYSPGLAFYQRVQSIMARVSNIDPWHRTRGTVSDETEVMAAGLAISQDLQNLEAQRPALMDHAVAGSLTGRHLAPDIASAITRSYRTYWANYQAASIHLHRVAYKHLPATSEVLRARSTIKQIARLLDQAQESLPVNFIWPLLMACCEEDNTEDRNWMIQCIRGMQGVASNAKPIADVLEEVHRRQDTSKQRADVRQASMDLFNMSFAVV